MIPAKIKRIYGAARGKVNINRAFAATGCFVCGLTLLRSLLSA